MMSQQSGDPFAALIRVNTVVQAVAGNGNTDIRGETRAEYQGRQISIQNDRNSPESKHNDQTEKDENAQKCQPGQYKTSRWVCVCVCECGLSSPIDEHQVNW